jgi:ethanolamine utilization protein EutN
VNLSAVQARRIELRIAKTIGTVTLSQVHPALTGARLKLVEPLGPAGLAGRDETPSETLVVYDDLGAGYGSLIAVSEGGEAAQPFRPELKPVDAYNAAILDRVDVVRQ